jgi:hypothetical protein
MVLGPPRDADEVGIRQRASVSKQPFLAVEHPFQVGMRLGDLGRPERPENIPVRSFHAVLEGVPERGEGREEARVEEGQNLVEPVEPRRALGIGQSLADPPCSEVVEDGHALADRLARGGHQRWRFAHGIDPAVGVTLHDLGHLDAAEPVRLPEPLQGHDRAERATRRDAVHEGLNHVCLLVSVTTPTLHHGLCGCSG